MPLVMSRYRFPLLSLALFHSGFNHALAQTPGGFEVVVGDSLASAMMMGLINQDSVFILDKVQNNRAKLDSSDRPVTGSILSLSDNTVRAIDVRSNAFCATGSLLPNGSWAVFGGNQAVGYGGKTVSDGQGPYEAIDGRKAIRLLNPANEDEDLVWLDDTSLQMTNTRWYAASETLSNGEVVILGGETSGGFINRNIVNEDPAYSNGAADPTFEFFPSRNVTPAVSQFMVQTSGLNTYAHMFTMPSGKIFMQANWSTTLWDYNSNIETSLPDSPDRIVRVYPASAAVAMKPLTKSNDYTPTILFCGGTNGLTEAQWGWYGGPGSNILDIEASDDCSSITPETPDGSFNSSVEWVREEKMPQGRTMGQFIHLPTGQMVIVNGANRGTAGYTNATYNILPDETPTEGLAQDPIYQPLLYDPSKPLGSRLSNEGFGSSTIARLYHSTAILVPDGSVLIAGSSPHQDVALDMPVGTTPQAFNTTYEVEKWYPPYYFETRPGPGGMPDRINYGGSPFNITMDAEYMGASANYKANNTKFMVIRPGFSTHAMNMGQRSLQLEHTYTVNEDGTVDYMVNPMPTNPSVFVPGPALLFVTIDGVPSVGKFVQLGDLLNKTLPAQVTIGSEWQVLPSAINNSAFNEDPTKSAIENFGVAKLAGIIAGGAAVLFFLLIGLICWRRRRRAKATSRAKILASRESFDHSLVAGVGSGGKTNGDRNGDYERVKTPNFSYHQAFDSSPAPNPPGGALDSHLNQYQMNDFPPNDGLNGYFESPAPLSPTSHFPSHQQQHQSYSQSSLLPYSQAPHGNRLGQDQDFYDETAYEKSQPSDYYNPTLQSGHQPDPVEQSLIAHPESRMQMQFQVKQRGEDGDGYDGLIDHYAQEEETLHPHAR